MIWDDLKERLDGKNLDEVFLKHRPGIDQPGYRVGKVGEEVVVLNESGGEIMDYFYDDVPDKEWYSLSLYKPEYEGYEINKNTGRIRNVNTGNILVISNRNGYSLVKGYIKGKWFGLFVHVCLGNIFIPNLNPYINYIVDHIDRNRSNNSLNNFRWVDKNTSRENQNRDDKYSRYQYFAYSDKEMNNLAYKFDCVEDIISTLEIETTNRKYVVGSINRCINKRKSTYYKGYYWKRENVVLKHYLEHLGYSLDAINLDDFIYNPVYGVQVNTKLGIIITKTNLITCGWKEETGYYRIHIGKRFYTTSHIIWSTANGCAPFPESKEVDHINSDPLDNRAENLQLVDSHSDNMKNPNTQAKIKAAKEAKKTQKN